jgi:hypothetical protein
MARPKSGYKLKDGTRVPGVTTIIGRFKESGALLYWAFEQGKAAERGEIAKLYDKRDEAAQAGTLAHEMVEAHIKGQELPSMIEYPVDIGRQARQGFENYLNWQTNNRIEIEEQEISLVSEKYRYGGTPDGIGKDSNGNRVLIDWKNSTGGKCYVDYILQLASYKQLWQENHPDRPITGGFHLCIFSKEHADFHHHHYSELDDAWKQFRLLREAFDLDKKLKKRV